MATYKMIQDIEAEDHIIGPLSLRQFIYALISAFLLYINFLCLSKHIGFLMILFLPPALFTGFFAFPFGRDQPTEVWALAKIRFLFKPRRRIWDQSGVKELVEITVPKKIERHLTNGLSQSEVQSRLSALANTIDSRGWAVKNVNVNLYANPGSYQEASDRLIDINSLPREVPNYDVQASDDILDENNNPIAQQFETMINESTRAYRQQLIDRMNSSTPVQTAPPTGQRNAPNDYWFLNQAQLPADTPADQAVFATPSVVAPGMTPTALPVPSTPAPTDLSEEALMAKIKAQEAADQAFSSHLRTLQPLSEQTQRTPRTAPAPVTQQPAPQVAPASPPAPDPAILSLAGNNDLNIATLARQAGKSKHDGDDNEREVVISLR